MISFRSLLLGRPNATVMQKKGCSKAALWDLQCYQRLKTYIVTSKPKRISVYSGLVHMVRLLQRVNPLHRGFTAASSRPWYAFCLQSHFRALQENTEIRLMIFIRFSRPCFFSIFSLIIMAL